MNDTPTQNTRPPLRVGQVIKRGEFFYGHPGGLEGNVGDMKSSLQHPLEYDYRQPDRKAADYNSHEHNFYTIGSGVLMLADSPNKQTAADFNISGRPVAIEYVKPAELHKLGGFVKENERYGTAIGVIADDKTPERNLISSHVRIIPVSNNDYIEDYNKPKKDFLNKTIYDYHFNPETYKMPKYEVEKGAVIIDLSELGKEDLKKTLQNLRNGILPEGVERIQNESLMTPYVVIRKGIDGKKPEGGSERENDGDWVAESYVKYKGKYEAVTSANYENGFADGMGKPEIIKRTYGDANLSHEKASSMSATERADFLQNNNMPTERVLLTKKELYEHLEQVKNLSPNEIDRLVAETKVNDMATSYLLLSNEKSDNKDRFKNFRELSTLNHMIDVLVNNDVQLPKNFNSPDIADFISNDKNKPKEVSTDEQKYLSNILTNARFSPDTKIEISGKGETQEIKLNLRDEAYKFDRDKGSFVKE